MATVDPVYRAIDDLGKLVEEKFRGVNRRLGAIEKRLGLTDDEQLLGGRGRRLIDAIASAALGAVLAGALIWALSPHHHL